MADGLTGSRSRVWPMVAGVGTTAVLCLALATAMPSIWNQNPLAFGALAALAPLTAGAITDALLVQPLPAIYPSLSLTTGAGTAWYIGITGRL